MLIQQKPYIGKKEMFYVEEDGQLLAQMIFMAPAPHKIIVEHTEVDASMEGKGLAKALVHHAVEYARTNNLKITPFCPYTKAVLARTPEWQDVLEKQS